MSRRRAQRMITRSALMIALMFLAIVGFQAEGALWVHTILFVVLFLVLRPI